MRKYSNWGTPLPTSEISNADVTFTINFCLHDADNSMIFSDFSFERSQIAVVTDQKPLPQANIYLRQPRWWVVLCSVKQLSSG